MRGLTINWTPIMQYHRLVRTACSSRVYHIAVLGDSQSDCGGLFPSETHRMIKVGWTQDSKMPNRKRTAIKAPQLVAAAEHVTTAPHRNTLLRVSSSSLIC